ncbi:uncharacterized protein LOC122374896 isoform X1 [Amphibalanus amphitrite]|uniref:uncharacterized protein LOC122374896 isoform X1 n=1 Tax=Amphibalanus amphitrite TaxID=1232801 RepID=UPI001C91F6C1|nr:uncharacterized protein LOC122374896 isoform X1 [Amphibalanus amphitrite]
MRSSTSLLWLLGAAVLAVRAEHHDGLFSFGGLESLRDPECVPESYRLPERISAIADECMRRVEQAFESQDDLDRLSAELAVLNDPKNQARNIGGSVRRFQLGIRDCMAESMGVVDDAGEFVEQRLEEEISALGFPAPFERDVQAASRACLHHTPADLSVEQRQNFYYVCRDSLLESSCMYKRLARDDPDRALDIGIQQTECLENLKPTPTIVSAMDECRDAHEVPVQYATLRRRRSVPDAGAEPLEGSGETEEAAEKPASVTERVHRFIYCVFDTIGALRQDGQLDVTPLIEQLKQFEGDERAVKLQVDAATHCQDKTSIEEYNMCYYDDVSAGCHIFKVQQAFLAGDPALLPEY